MPTLRERLTTLVGGRAYRDTHARAAAFDAAYHDLPALFTPSRLLREMNPESLHYLMQSLGYQRLNSFGETEEDFETLRQAEVKRARWMYRTDAVVNRAVRMWTSFGFGQKVEVHANDPDAQAVWDAFANAHANDPIIGAANIQSNSNHLLVDGELFWPLFVAKVDGSVKVRRVPTEQVTHIITVPDDADQVIAYERQSIDAASASRTRWYRSIQEQEWLAEWPDPTSPATWAQDENDATDVYMQHVKINSLGKRGVPLVATGLQWADSYKTFLENRLTLSRAVASFLEDVTVKGGSRAVDAVKATLASRLATSDTWPDQNPAPAAGSYNVHNEGVDFQRKPLSTGAGDAGMDGMTILGQASMGLGGMPPMWLGRTDTAQNRSVAEVSIIPTLKDWDAYQLLWRNVFADLFEFVLTMAERYPGGRAFPDKGCTVTMDTPLASELATVAPLIFAMADKKLIAPEDAARLLLRRSEFGVQDLDEVILRAFPPEEDPAAQATQAAPSGGAPKPEEPASPDATVAPPPSATPVQPAQATATSLTVRAGEAREAQAGMMLGDLFKMAYAATPTPELREAARKAAETALKVLGEGA